MTREGYHFIIACASLRSGAMSKVAVASRRYPAGASCEPRSHDKVHIHLRVVPSCPLPPPAPPTRSRLVRPRARSGDICVRRARARRTGCASDMADLSANRSRDAPGYEYVKLTFFLSLFFFFFQRRLYSWNLDSDVWIWNFSPV